MKKKHNLYKIHHEFLEYKYPGNPNKKSKNISSEDIRVFYEHIKKQYMEMENLNINLEKIYLEKKLGLYNSKNINIYEKILWIGFTAFISKLFVENDPTSNFISFFIIFLAVLFIIFTDRKEIRTNSNSILYYNICLKVLSELENENLKNIK